MEESEGSDGEPFAARLGIYWEVSEASVGCSG